MSCPPTVQGVSIPGFLYGTAWKEERTEDLTSLALGCGFIGIDTANQRRHYYEAGVGNAVAAAIGRGERTRADLFLQTKFTYARGQDHRIPYDANASYTEQVADSFQSSLQHLQSSYVDSYVLHGPESGHGVSQVDWEVWRAMEALQRAGKTRLIGVSNISLRQLELLFAGAEVKPAFVQNRCFARTGWDREVRAFCGANDVVYQGFSLLTANARELETPAVARIVEATGGTLAQVVFRFAMQMGMLPLTGTSDATHMTDDLACVDLELSEAELRTIEAVALP